MTEEYVQNKGKAKALEEEGPSEVQTGSLFRKEFRVVIVGMIKELGEEWLCREKLGVFNKENL